MAIEYGHRLRKESPGTSILWVYASNLARFRESYEAIAKELRLPGFDDPKTDLLNAVYQWLLSESSGPWLLILDNADDVNIIQNNHDNDSRSEHSSRTNIQEYLPQRAGGAILITSRDRNAALALLSGPDLLIDIAAMSQTEARSLINSKIAAHLGNDHDKDDLASALDCIPLAITQAVAYINRRQRMTTAKYLNLLKDEQQETTLLNQGLSDLRRDPSVHNSVIRTWQISFEQIRVQSPLSADLLCRTSMFDRQNIPEFLLCVGMSDREFEDAVETLLALAFMSAENDRTSFNMHRLVQLAMREWLRVQEAAKEHQVAALRMLYETYPVGTFENRAICSALEPHAQVLLNHLHVTVDAEPFQMQILYRRATYHYTQGHYGASQHMLAQALSDSRESLGPDDNFTLDVECQLALTYQVLGQITKAETLLIHAVEIRKKMLGQEHLKTLTSTDYLGSVLLSLGRTREAEELQRQVLASWKRLLGSENQYTLETMCALATTLVSQYRSNEAENLVTQVLEARKRILGEDDPATQDTMYRLVSIYQFQGRHKKAEELGLQVLGYRKKANHPEHPDILNIMSTLADVYVQQKRWKEAETLSLQVLATRERTSSLEHPDTSFSLSVLASMYYDQEQYEEVEKLYSQVLEARKRLLGQEHPENLVSMYNLALTWKKQGRTTEAVSLMQSCYQLHEKLFGSEHPDTKDSLETVNAWQMEEVEGND